MKTKLLALTLLVGGSLFAQPRVAIGIGIGGGYGYYPPVVAVRPPCPGPGYAWVNGYWGAGGGWVGGYWAPPAYGSPYWGGGGYYGRAYNGYYRRDWDRGRDWDHGRGYGRGYEREGHDRGRGWGRGGRR
jgi:hypothetical protein